MKQILKQMTTKEKIGQLTQVTPNFYNEQGNITGPLTAFDTVEKKGSLFGSVLGTKDGQQVRRIQEKHMKMSRLKIPLLFMADIVHGYHNIYPIPLAMASTWNMELIEEMADMTAQEASFHGVDVTFSPMVDLVQDPRWGRVLESSGEDVYLNSEVAKAYVKGYQGKTNDFSQAKNIVSCLKHFVGYGEGEGGRDYNTVNISRHKLFTEHMPPFEAGLNQGAKMVMNSFNTFEGVPAVANSFLIQEILRDKLKFEGVLISDWGSIGELISHKIAEDNYHASLKAIKNTIDIDMMSFSYLEELERLIEDSEEIEKLVDASVLRVLELKKELGLFDNPYRFNDVKVNQKNIQKSMVQSAEESMVLLKNNVGILPLDKEAKVSVKGPFSNESKILGAWSYEGATQNIETLQNVFQKEGNLVEYEFSDTVIYAFGEPEIDSGEGRSKANLKINQSDISALQKIKEDGKQIISVVFSGRPLLLDTIVDLSDAIIYAWFPGTKGAKALHNLIYGFANPSGKLTMSFPRSMGQIPVYYNALNTGRPYEESQDNNLYVSKYMDSDHRALFPFGYGLSYSNFEIIEVNQSKKTLKEKEILYLEITLKNDSEITGSTVLQLYINDLVAEISRPNRELIKFKKVKVEAGESVTVNLEIKYEDLMYLDQNIQQRLDTGIIDYYLGFDSLAEKYGSIEIKK